jgi:protein-arginine deiminase
MRENRSRLLWAVLVCLLLPLNSCGGCKKRSSGGDGGGGGGGGGGTQPVPGTAADIDVDNSRDGIVDNTNTDDVDEELWTTTHGAVYYWNIDDDDNDVLEDHKDTIVNGVNDALDLARVWLRQYTQGLVGGSVTVKVDPAGAQGSVRIFRNNGGWTQVYSAGASFTLPVADIAAGDIELGIESTKRLQPTWNGYVTLTLELRDSGSVLVSSDAVQLRQAPFLMATNLWKTDELDVVNVGSNNLAFRTALQTVCTNSGTTYVEAPGGSYSNDRWIQDGHEPGIVYLTTSGSPRRRVNDVLQLARYRPIDAWCKNVLFNPDFDFIERFAPDTNQSLNYGGNLEVVPPHTAPGGTNYAWGRILCGGGSSFKIGTTTTTTRYMDVIQRDFFNACVLQGTYLMASTEWLAVGHVDEYLCFVPAPATSRGWVLALGNPNTAKTILQNVQATGGGAKTVFTGRTGWQTTVDAILANAALMTFNNEVQIRIDSIRNYLKTNIGLADSEIIDVPVLYEDSGSGWAAAYNPGVANIMPVVSASGAVHLVIPDPEGPDHPSTDAWQADMLPKLTALGTGPKPVTCYFVDVFFSYHTLLGEAHCGLNTVRTPPAMDWWDK